MKNNISTLALVAILAAPLAASADTTQATTKAPDARPAAVVMQQRESASLVVRSTDDRQGIDRLEYQSRQLGPTN